MSQLKSYLDYRLRRVNAHGIHSPFVFEFYNEVVLKAKLVDDSNISRLRKMLERNKSVVKVEDFGAGSVKSKSNQRTVSSIVKNVAVTRKFGRLLARLADHYKVESAVELGTSLGIGTSYLAISPSVKKIITLEGSAEIAKLAQANFDQLNLKNITLLNGKFDDQLEAVKTMLPKTDLVYIDGNHRYQPTMDYFNFFIDHAHDDTFLIFDDIYWSDEMSKAWQEICASPKINVSMDLFRMGIVCKRSKQAKEHFVLKY